MKKLKYQLILIVFIVFGAFFMGIIIHEGYHVIRGSPDNPKDLCITIGGEDSKSNVEGGALAYVKWGGGAELNAYFITFITAIFLICIGYRSMRACSK